MTGVPTPPAEQTATPLAPLTTLRLGGPARRLVEVDDERELVAAVRELDAAGEPLLVLAGGSNVVIADAGFDGTVVLVRTRGVELAGDDLLVAAGEPWDGVVEQAIAAEGWPGSRRSPASPARPARRRSRTSAPTGRTSARRSPPCACSTAATAASASCRPPTAASATAPARSRAATTASCWRCGSRSPVRGPRLATARAQAARAQAARGRRSARRSGTPKLARRLGVEVGERAPLREVREAVLALRRGKGMVVDPDDPDSISAGSFFTNPILDADAYERLAAAAASFDRPAAGLPRSPTGASRPRPPG